MIFSVVCPVFNEAPNIQRIVDFFCRAEPQEKELIFVDGGSHDGTIEIIEENCAKYPSIRIVHNVMKTVPYALNLAIPLCTGLYIVRLDGHSSYADDYFIRILEAFRNSNAGIVGGPTRTQYQTLTQEAIAFAISHPFGIGGSRVHDCKFEGYTDSVTFGAWKRDIFAVVGYFDIKLVRNQDDEFHYRAKSLGIKIFQSPDIKVYYSPRTSLMSLLKQYFQYGLYKPLVLMKIRSEAKIRHLIPSCFVLYLLLLVFFNSHLFYLPLAIYFLLICSVSFINSKTLGVQVRILLALPCLHIGYGTGFMIGVGKLFR